MNTRGKRLSSDEPHNIDGGRLTKKPKEETKEAAQRLEGALNELKSSTQRLLEEIRRLLEANEKVTMDFKRVQDSQQAEAQRLEHLEPDVDGASQFSNPAHLLSVMSAMNRPR